MQFAGSHILSVNQFQRADIEAVFAVADRMEPYAHRRRIMPASTAASTARVITAPTPQPLR